MLKTAQNPNLCSFFTDAFRLSNNCLQISDDRYRKLCNLCNGQNCPALSTVQKDFALTCLTQTPSADVAFVPATVLRENLRQYFPDAHL